MEKLPGKCINKVRSIYSITQNSPTDIKYTELMLLIYSFSKVPGPEGVKKGSFGNPPGTGNPFLYSNSSREKKGVFFLIL